MSNRQQIVAAVLVGLSLSGTLAAQVEVDRRRPAPPKGEVRIDNAFGSVAVKGWDRGEVLVQGTVAAGAEGFDFDSDREGTSISVSVPDAWFQAAGEDPAFRTTLTVFVPAGSSVGVETVNAGVSVEGVNGDGRFGRGHRDSKTELNRGVPGIKRWRRQSLVARRESGKSSAGC